MCLPLVYPDMSLQHATSSERDVQPTQLLASAGLGLIAAVLGYLLSYLLVAGEARNAAFAEIAEWKVVAWYFYNGHFVDVIGTSSIGDFGSAQSIDFIAQSSAASTGLLYILPPLVLVGVGGLLAYRLDAGNVEAAVLAGTPVTIGYAIFMTGGAFLARASTEASFVGVEVSGSIAPQLLPAIVLGGLLYPLVFATAGALLVVALRSN